ncbi:MAG: hypothetical protein ABJ308_13180 [Halieaceae bacterium]
MNDTTAVLLIGLWCLPVGLWVGSILAALFGLEGYAGLSLMIGVAWGPPALYALLEDIKAKG